MARSSGCVAILEVFRLKNTGKSDRSLPGKPREEATDQIVTSERLIAYSINSALLRILRCSIIVYL